MDAFYEEFKVIRKRADDTMKVINKDYGMSKFRAYYTHKSVRAFGEKHALPIALKTYLNKPYIKGA